MFGNVKELKECYVGYLQYLFEKYSDVTLDKFSKKDLICLAYYQGVMGRIDQMALLVGRILGLDNGLDDLQTYDLKKREFSPPFVF